ncbi:MAG: lpdA [Paenibacillaceae bacterium]|nr:lpdA [Paenibacillaceae bacterium]
MTKQYDVVVLGGGTGGYVAAIRAAQLGRSVAIVEQDKLGGTCLHRGCIPTKALLRSAELAAAMRDSGEFGLSSGPVTVHLPKVQERKQKIVDQLHRGVQYLMKKNKIDIYSGRGRVIGPSIFSPKSGAVAVELENDEAVTLVPSQLIIATGSRPRLLPGMEADGEQVMTSDHALEMEQLPKSVVIIGGGVIGVEWASMLHDFGVEVTVVEYDKRLVPYEDAEVSKELERLFRRRGIKSITGAKVLPDSIIRDSAGVTLVAERNGEKLELHAEKVLVSVGRQANVEGLGLENTDILVERGVIKVNEFMQTAESHIYAIGDVNGGMQLAHAASHEGILAVEHFAGEHPSSYAAHLIPRCIYGRPEISSVGWTEEQAKEQGYEVKTGKFTFKALGKAMVHGDADGFVKVVADGKSGDILGVHMIGAQVTDLISEAALAQLLNATPWEVGSVIHPHPTMSEALMEAMLAVDGRAIGM